VLGITGESGCGKSTLLRLLLGLEKATEGRIYYDNINMEQINLSKLRKQIGLVFQKSQLLPGSILDNILAGEQSLTRREVWDLLYRLDIHEMVQDWPMGLDTMVSDGMQTLSGGEIQRIMLARALIRAPRLLFFDEATSALDNACQDKVHQYLQQLEVTQVIIAHRLSTLKHTNKIIVFEKGQVSQVGSYDDLLSQPGYFATLAKQQINTY